MFTSGENSNHVLFFFQDLGEDEDIFTSSAMKESDPDIFYNPRGQLKNLKAEDEMHNLACVSDLKCEDLTQEG